MTAASGGFPSVGEDLLRDIPVREFDVPDLDLDDLPPDLQALLARDCEASAGGTGASNNTESLSIPSDLQDIIRSREPSRGSPESPVGLEWKVDFNVLRRSNTLASGLPLAVQRSARKLEREAPVVQKMTRGATPNPPSRQSGMSASGLIALASRALADSFHSSASKSAGTPTMNYSPVINTTDAEIDRLLKHTIMDDDIEQFLKPSSTDCDSSSATDSASYSLAPPRGLMNLGNTCFLNAAIQALGHCTPLVAYMLQGLFVPDLNQANPLGTGCVLTMVFGALLHELYALQSASNSDASASWSANGYADSQSQAFPPLDFLLAVAQFHPFLASGEMHDAQELLAWLLDALHEDLNRVRRPSADGGTAHRMAMAVQGLGAQVAEIGQERFAAEAWRNHLLKNRSVIVDLFQGQLRSQLRCPECGLVSMTFDPFLHLTLPLPVGPDSIRLEDAVNLFCREEALDGDNVYECQGCQRKVRAAKKLDLWKLPPLLCVNLKRFEWLEVERKSCDPWELPYRVRKLDCFVEFTEEGLDLAPLVAAEAPQKDALVYNLMAVIDHLGSRADAGHYTATCRRPDGWYRFDDAYVSPLAPGMRAVCRHNYVLLFERVGTPREPADIAEQRASAPHAWPHVIDIDWSFLTGSNSGET